MINLQNPPGSPKSAGSLSLGENRVYFGLWSLMKAPLLLSTHLPDLVPELLAIANSSDVIAVNQDSAGVQARKLAIDGQVGTTACRHFSSHILRFHADGAGFFSCCRGWLGSRRATACPSAATLAALRRGQHRTRSGA